MEVVILFLTLKVWLDFTVEIIHKNLTNIYWILHVSHLAIYIEIIQNLNTTWNDKDL